MDGVTVTFGNRGMTMEAARQCEKDWKAWRATVHMSLNDFHADIFAWPVFFRTALLCSGGYHLERRGMPLRDAIPINCKSHGILLLLFLLKTIGSARLRESDIHPISPKTPAPQYQPIDRKKRE